jgi:hypothetical protein
MARPDSFPAVKTIRLNFMLTTSLFVVAGNGPARR